MLVITKNEIIPLEVESVLYFEADECYTTIHLPDKQHVISQPMGSLLKKLPNNFYRVHNSFLINIRKIDRIVKNGEYYVIMNNKTEIQVSRRRKSQFLKKLKELYN
jgi:two-component system LytT family response regulator